MPLNIELEKSHRLSFQFPIQRLNSAIKTLARVRIFLQRCSRRDAPARHVQCFSAAGVRKRYIPHRDILPFKFLPHNIEVPCKRGLRLVCNHSSLWPDGLPQPVGVGSLIRTGIDNDVAGLDQRKRQRDLEFLISIPCFPRAMKEAQFHFSQRSFKGLGLLAQKVDGDFAAVGMGAVFPKVNALPGAEGHGAVRDGNGHVDGREGGADVGGHVIVALGGVFKERIAVGNQALKKPFEVAADFGIGIFLDEQGGGSVLNVQGDNAGFESGLRDELFRFSSDFVESASFRLQGDFGALLSQHPAMMRGQLSFVTAGRDAAAGFVLAMAMGAANLLKGCRTPQAAG